MKIKEFNLLEIAVYDGEQLIYDGMSEDVPEDLKNQSIQIVGIDGKKLITKLEK